MEKIEKVVKSDAEWRAELDPMAYEVLRHAATEAPFTGQYAMTKVDGVYHCAGCGAELFRSNEKYDSGCGWPSFTDPAIGDAVTYHRDLSHGMIRTEVRCARCDGHLGHVFDDGPGENGQRFCINSAALQLQPEGR